MPTAPPTVPALPAFPAVSNRTTYNQEAFDCLNTLAATVRSVREDTPGYAMVAVRTGHTQLLARISQYSAQQLHLETGQSLFIQVKSVALLD